MSHVILHEPKCTAEFAKAVEKSHDCPRGVNVGRRVRTASDVSQCRSDARTVSPSSSGYDPERTLQKEAAWKLSSLRRKEGVASIQPWWGNCSAGR